MTRVETFVFSPLCPRELDQQRRDQQLLGWEARGLTGAARQGERRRWRTGRTAATVAQVPPVSTFLSLTSPYQAILSCAWRNLITARSRAHTVCAAAARRPPLLPIAPVTTVCLLHCTATHFVVSLLGLCAFADAFGSVCATVRARCGQAACLALAHADGGVQRLQRCHQNGSVKSTALSRSVSPPPHTHAHMHSLTHSLTRPRAACSGSPLLVVGNPPPLAPCGGWTDCVRCCVLVCPSALLLFRVMGSLSRGLSAASLRDCHVCSGAHIRGWVAAAGFPAVSEEAEGSESRAVGGGGHSCGGDTP